RPDRRARRDRRAGRHDPEPGLLDGRRAAPVGCLDAGRGRADALRVGAGDGRVRPDPGRPAEHLSVDTVKLNVRTGGERGFTDLTGACRRFVAEHAAGGDGLLSVFVPHATAGVVILELGAGSDDDALDTLDRLLPRDDRWRHRHGSAGHGADHVVPLLAAPSVTVPVIGGELALGTWQSIALLDPNADNPERTVLLSFLAG